MARRSRKAAVRPARRARWVPLAAAYAVGLACATAGVLVLVYGDVDPLTGGETVKGTVSNLGIGLCLLGILGVALTGYLHWARRQR